MGDPREVPPPLTGVEPTPAGRPSFLSGLHNPGIGGRGAMFTENPPPQPSMQQPPPQQSGGGGGPVYNPNIPPGPPMAGGGGMPEPAGGRLPRSMQSPPQQDFGGYPVPRTPSINDVQTRPQYPQQPQLPYPYPGPSGTNSGGSAIAEASGAENGFKKYLPYIGAALLLGAIYYYYVVRPQSSPTSSSSRKVKFSSSRRF
jgi:hypothetical protein